MAVLCLWSLIRFCLFPPCRFNFEDETPTTNFDTFPAAILTVFQVKVNSTVLSSLVFCLYHWTGLGVSPADPYWGGLERSHVSWDRITGGSSRGNVLLHLFHRSHSLWKLYPTQLMQIDSALWLSGTVIVNVYSVLINRLIFS